MTDARAPQASKAHLTRARILDAAAKVFRSQGYIGTRLSDIAKIAGLQGGSLYYHFESRDALAEAVLYIGMERTIDVVERRIADLESEATPAERLRAAITAHAAAVLEVGDYASAAIRLLSQVPESIRHRTEMARLDYDRYWGTLLGDAIRTGEIRPDVDKTVIRLLIFGALNSAAEWYHPDRGLSGSELSEQVADLFFFGLTRRPDRRPAKVRQAPDVGALPASSDATQLADGGQPRAVATRARILGAAAVTFRKKGYAASRLTDIAAEAGLRTPSLYYHFPSREDLVVELMRIAWEHTATFVTSQVSAMSTNARPSDRLVTAISAHLTSALEGGERTAAVIQIMGQVPEEVRRQSLEDQREYLRFWRSILNDGVGAGEFRTDVDLPAMLMMLMGALNWTVEWFDPKTSPSPREIAGQLATLVIDGLSNPLRRSHRPQPRKMYQSARIG